MELGSQINSKSDPHAASANTARTILHIRPSKGWVSIKLDELWQYRELLYFLVWRDIKVRYKQTTLGATWAIIQPVFTMILWKVGQDTFGRHTLSDL